MSGAFRPAVRQLVMVRAWFACERDGRTDGLEIHHRRPRKAGGTSDPTASTAANALVLCHVCHRWVETHRQAAYRLGYLVHAAHDPADVAVPVYELRAPALLTETGEYEPTRNQIKEPT